MNDSTVPDEFMHCFNIADDYTATEPMEVEEDSPDIAETVELEWHQWQPGQEKPKPSKEDQLGIKALVKLSDFKQWEAMSHESEGQHITTTSKRLEDQSLSASKKDERGEQETGKPKTRTYRSYSPQQVQELIDMVEMLGLSARKAGLTIGINARTAHYYVKKYRDDDEKRVPLPRSTANISYANNRKLFEDHTKFLCDIFDKRADLTLWEAREMLLNTFPEIYDITLSALHKHLVAKASLTLKKLEKFTAPRESETTLKIRHDRVLEWINDTEMSWESNCVFLDEAGFNLHLRRNFGRSIRGKPARVIVPANRGVTITIVGAICELGIIDLSLKRPQAQIRKVARPKKRKLQNEEVQTKTMTVTGKVGTRTEHFLHFLSGVLDELDRNGMTGRYIVMDNAPIHKSPEVAKTIESRGYRLAYLPPYSPFLNPIEEFWSKVKAGVKRDTLTMNSNLSDRIVDSAKKVTVSDCQGWIRHSPPRRKKVAEKVKFRKNLQKNVQKAKKAAGSAKVCKKSCREF
ncbi:hypothetical protein PS15p_212245 [Mucor circinelloides]